MAQRSEVAGGFDGDTDLAPQAEVERRATLLCRRAEPHADQAPCASHITEANRQLIGVTA